MYIAVDIYLYMIVAQLIIIYISLYISLNDHDPLWMIHGISTSDDQFYKLKHYKENIIYII